jgi:HNH endonuclease
MSDTKTKKKTVPKVLRDLSWSKWIGEEIGKSKCFCCEVNEIKMSSFHCGHVVAEVNGGKTTVDNLRPICSACNLSMGSENLTDFKTRCGFNKPAEIKPEVKKEEEIVAWYPGILRAGIVPNRIKWVPGTNSLDCMRELTSAGYKPVLGVGSVYVRR